MTSPYNSNSSSSLPSSDGIVPTNSLSLSCLEGTSYEPHVVFHINWSTDSVHKRTVTYRQLSLVMFPSSGGTCPVSLLPCKYLKEKAPESVKTRKEYCFSEKTDLADDTNSLPVQDRLPSIGGMGPTSSFSLRSLRNKIWTQKIIIK